MAGSNIWRRNPTVIVGLVGLIGTILGAAVAVVGGLASAAATADADDDRAVRELRVDAYADFLGALYTLLSPLETALDRAEDIDGEGDDDANSLEELRRAANAAFEGTVAVNQAFARVEVVGEPEVVARAQQVMDLANQVSRVLNEVRSGESTGTEALGAYDWNDYGSPFDEPIDVPTQRTTRSRRNCLMN